MKPSSEVATSPFVFAVGCPRSGTTLLQRMLDAHPELAVANDTHFVTRCVEKFARSRVDLAERGVPVPFDDELREGVQSYRRFWRLGVDRDFVAGAMSRAGTWNDLVAELYTELARVNGKRLGGEKTPDFVRRIPLLVGLFPNTKVLHIIRDGRDVALSVREWANGNKGPGKLDLWREDPLAVAALWWRWQVNSGRQAGARCGSRCYHEMSYERLAADPEPELRSACEFLGLDFDPAMVAFWEGKRQANAGSRLSAKSAWLPATAGLRDWRSQLRDVEIELFEALAGDLLEQLGYERAFHRISPAVAAIAASQREWWNEHLERRRRKESQNRA